MAAPPDDSHRDPLELPSPTEWLVTLSKREVREKELLKARLDAAAQATVREFIRTLNERDPWAPRYSHHSPANWFTLVQPTPDAKAIEVWQRVVELLAPWSPRICNRGVEVPNPRGTPPPVNRRRSPSIPDPDHDPMF